jgi:hypothetical protein
VRPKTGAGCDGALLEIDRCNVAHMQVGPRQETANGAGDIQEATAPRHNLGQQRLEDKIVFFVDQGDLKVIASAQGLL